jgi:lipid II:glycine glycyltransferase (peptidoglycan interpeptide bridge formation enzyme)
MDTAAQIWDDAVLRHNGSFLQSWAWGEFQNAAGNPVVRTSDSNHSWVAQWVRQSVHFGTQLACYHGPTPFTVDSIRAASEAVQHSGAQFLHLESPYREPSNPPSPVPSGWRRGQFRQAPATQVLDLTQSLDELRSELHSKTRYNIGLAERAGVTVRVHRSADAIEPFLTLLPKTSERHHIAAHAPAYYRSMAQALAPTRMLSVFTAERDGRIIAAHAVVLFGKTATYLHGASDYGARKYMAPHLLQWHQIRWAMEQGAKTYDFWGVAPPNAGPSHPFFGITRFKQAFGGRTLVSGGAYDLPLKRLWYTLYRAAKKLRG